MLTGSVSAQGSGPVAAYSFNEFSGTDSPDVSGNGHTATVNGAVWTANGRYGGAMEFDGVNDLATIATSSLLDFTTGMTLEAWVYPTVSGGWQTVILRESASGLSYALYEGNDAGSPVGYVRSGGVDRGTPGVGPLPLNTWSHLATTFGGGHLRMFVNGVEVTSEPVPSSIDPGATALRIGGNAVWGEHFRGRIDDVRIYNRALTAAEILLDSSTPVGGAPPPPPPPPVSDTTAPTVAVTAPLGGALLSGTVTLTASASDDVGVSGVQFRVNGSPLGAEDITAPYNVAWVTTSVADGSYNLTAVARDGAGNTSESSVVGVTVINSPDAPAVGQWSAPFNLGITAVSMIMLHTGEVLMYSGENMGGSSARLWNPATGVMTGVPANDNLFCSAQVQLTDGRIMVIGGHDTAGGQLGASYANIFDPVAGRWQLGVANMASRRWYPTATTLGDGRVVVASGATTCLTCIAEVPEVYDPETFQWTSLTSARLNHPYYPFMFLLPDGRVLNAGASEEFDATRTLDLATGTWTTVDPRILDGGSAAMYRPGKIIKTGASATSGDTGAANAGARVLDMTAPSPAWREIAPMAFPRAYHNMVILPDGNVLAVGGGKTRDGWDSTQAVLAPELWSQATESWRTLAPMQESRLYHGTALLLPDGRVLVAGSGADFGPGFDSESAEIYSPPYIFKGARPVISFAPATLTYGESFPVQVDQSGIAAFSLIRLGATTHGVDMDQRYLDLVFSPGEGGFIVTAPASVNLAPPGYYMLFALNSNGVPSVAKIVRLLSPFDTTAPTAPGALVASTDLTRITLQWAPSVDDTVIANYNVYRSTTQNFPLAGNWFAHSAGTTYIDPVALAGTTYYYKVVAVDGVGNVSAPSNEASATIPRDTIPPTVTVTGPAEGATVSGTAVLLEAAAADDRAVIGVLFFVDGAPVIPEDTTAPYALAWNSQTIGDGTHVVTARASDGAGNSTTSAGITVTVNNATPPPPPPLPDTTAPSVSVTAPVQDSTVSGATVSFNATAGDDVGVAGVLFLVDGGPAGAEDTIAPYEIAWDSTSVANGTHVVSARARDAAGNTADSAAVTITVDNVVPPPPPPDTTAPTVSVTAPAVGDTVAGTNVLFTANASDNVGVAGVVFLVNGVAAAEEDTSAPYAASWNSATVGDGQYVLSALARDAAGNTTLSPGVKFTVDNVVPPPPVDTTPPSVEVTAPVEGTTVSGIRALSATAIDNVAVAGVVFLVDGVQVGAEDTTEPYGASWDSQTVTDGTHVVTARARDAAGNVADSTAISVTVSNVVAPPPPPPPPPQVNGLVAAYNFNQGSGLSTPDASGAGNPGTISGAVWTDLGRFGQALSFDGINDRIDVADSASLDLTSSFTLEAWIYATSTSGRPIIAKEWEAEIAYSLFLHASSRPTALANVGGNDRSVTASTTVVPNTWTHVAATYDGSALRVYVNGVLVGLRPATGSVRLSSDALRIGGNVASGQYFRGRIDEVRIYNRALSTAEIQEDMGTPIP
jgi:hypothetical protein